MTHPHVNGGDVAPSPVDVALIDADVLRTSMRSRGIRWSRDLDRAAHALAKHVLTTVPREHVSICDVCGGDSDARDERCPYCGTEGYTIEPEPQTDVMVTPRRRRSEARRAPAPAPDPVQVTAPAPAPAQVDDPDPDDVLARMARSTEPTRPMPLGVPGVDDAIAGDLAPGSIVVLVGGPGSGKTALGCVAVRYRLQQGDRVVVVARDRDPRQWPRRLAALDGVSGTDAEIVAHLRASYPQLVVWSGSVERAFKLLGRGGTVAFDSLQTAKVDAPPSGPGDRERVEAVLGAIREGVTRTDALVLATSEQSRGATGLQAGRHSAGIEHAADALLTLQKDKQGRVCWSVEKTMKSMGTGTAGSFAIEAAGSLTDTTASEPGERTKATKKKPGKRRATNRPARTDAALDADVRAFVREHPGCSGHTIEINVPGKAGRIRDARDRVCVRRDDGGFYVAE